MFTDDSSSDTSSERSLSPSPPSPSYHGCFANPIKIPLKSCLSPPSTASADFPFSPLTPPSSSVSPHTVICAYPSWPAGDFLSAQPSTFGHVTESRGSQPSSHVSDDDLLGLEELELFEGVRVPKAMTLTSSSISWEATKQPPVVVRSTSKRPSAGGKKRRILAPYRNRSMKAMSPILEAPE
ncbi:MAG: hypothetical protein Q9211_002606 [Gyalolechia sp. 1 TL-2023]